MGFLLKFKDKFDDLLSKEEIMATKFEVRNTDFDDLFEPVRAGFNSVEFDRKYLLEFLEIDNNPTGKNLSYELLFKIYFLAYKKKYIIFAAKK